MIYLIRLLACWGIAFGLLHWEYPWSIYYGNFRFGWGETMESYIILATIMAGVGCWISPLVAGELLHSSRSPGALMALRFTLTFVTLVVMAVIFGPYGRNIALTRVRGIFFAEWQFMNFIFYCALPFAVSASLVMARTRKVLPKEGNDPPSVIKVS